MADFKIKPAAGTGNKLILESEDGTDVLTTSDSGVTLASATLTSPTLNSPTLVTPALGTVATGNLSNSAIVYPAGHIVNTWRWGPYNPNTGNSSSSIGETSGGAVVNFGSGWGNDMEITGITATEGNYLQILADPGDLFIADDGSTNTDIGPEIDGTWYSTASVYFYKSTDFIAPINLSMLFLVPASFSNKTIKIKASKNGGGGTMYLSLREYEGARRSIHMTVFEIQQ